MFIYRRTPFNERLNYFLKANNMTSTELSEKLGVSKSTVSLWLSGKRVPSDDHKYNMCDIFNVSLIDLMHTDEEVAEARIRYLFSRFNLDIEDFENITDLEKELGLKFLEIVGKYSKK